MKKLLIVRLDELLNVTRYNADEAGGMNEEVDGLYVSYDSHETLLELAVDQKLRITELENALDDIRKGSISALRESI